MNQDLEKFIARPLSVRQEESKRIIEKYPLKIPIVITRASHDKDLPVSKKYKFLIPKDLTIGQVLYIIRRHVQVKPDAALYLFVGDSKRLPLISDLVSYTYSTCKNEDGFLYMIYASETTFG
jgi:GABA(A) receptor-associated protein